MTKKEIISYDYYNELINLLLCKIQHYPKLKDIEFIYTFMRGGLPIAVHLSHHLGIPVYTDERGIDLTKIKAGSMLVVDDVADTGKTLEGFQFLFPTATLHYKPWSIVKPTFYVLETTNWIVYPWENPDEIPNR